MNSIDIEGQNDVFWIGGGSGAGKSTMASLLARKHGFRVYSCDEAMPRHARVLETRGAPYFTAFKSMDMNERWLQRSAEAMFNSFHWYQGEGFDLILDDLGIGVTRDVTADPLPIVVEGFRILPADLVPHLHKKDHALWLLPTPGFRKRVIEERGGTSWSFIARTKDPQTALRNLLDRDALFTEWLKRELQRLKLSFLTVTDTSSKDDVLSEIESRFGL